MLHASPHASNAEANALACPYEGIMAIKLEVSRELLQTSPLEGIPGWEMRLFLITYPPGADASKHSHPVIGMGLVLEGKIVSAFDNDPEEIFSAGQSFIDRASFHRVSRNGSQTEPLKFLIAYTVREGEPNTVWPQS
jgi:quercetin dioxygenase-like cupin family protein